MIPNDQRTELGMIQAPEDPEKVYGRKGDEYSEIVPETHFLRGFWITRQNFNFRNI